MFRILCRDLLPQKWSLDIVVRIQVTFCNFCKATLTLDRKILIEHLQFDFSLYSREYSRETQ